jgi:hypothetical protein
MRRAIALAFSLALALAAPAAAQQSGGKDEPPPFSSVLAQTFTKILDDELSLTDKQHDRVAAALEKGMAHLMEVLDAQANGKPTEDVDIKEEILSDLRGVLDDNQVAQLELLVKEFESQSGKFELTDPDAIDPATLLDDPDKAADLAAKRAAEHADLWFEGDLPSTDRLTLKAEDALLLTPDEKKVVLPRIRAVIEARRALRDRRHQRRADIVVAAHGGADQDELRDRLHGLRDEIKELERKLDKAQADLREVVTLDQEARLVALAILD